MIPTLTKLRAILTTGPVKNRRRTQRPVVAMEVLEERQLLAATSLQAFHRSGQTFITWTEDGSVVKEKYNVYRSTSTITTANISSAEKLTSKWGPLDDNTSVHSRVAPGTGVPANFVIQDLGTPLSGEKGLFVYTTPAAQSGSWYYAVTQVTAGVESLTLTIGANSLSTPVTETVATPSPILTVSNASGKGRIYTQFMDYAKWNPTFQGYAYNYSVALPDNYNPAVSWPVKLMPHAYGERFRMEPSAEYGWPCIEVFLDDSGGGAPGQRFQTWWYGFAADHNYLTSGSVPTSGRIENFTEQRVLKTIDEVTALFSADSLRIHSQGNSMGASGSLSLGMRYANVFSGIFASEPMTNYGTSPGFQNDFTVLWGSKASNLPVINNGPYAGPLKKYNGIGVYNWMNHQEQLINRRGDPMAFLMVGHGKVDDVIDWATQGQPFIAALNAGNVGFTAEQRGGWDHNWMGFDFSLDTMFSPTDGGLSAWAYPRNVSFPGITRATGSGPEQPGPTGTDFYNMKIEWSVPWNQFHSNIVDTSTAYEISLRSSTTAQSATVTPQRTQAFRPAPGTSVSWKNVNSITGQIVQSGTLNVDSKGLVTIPFMTIGTGIGNRLILTTQPVPTTTPVVTGPTAPTTSMTPEITWQGTDNTVSYDLMVRNLSTGVTVIRKAITGLAHTPVSPLGIGRYRITVRSRYQTGLYSAWSAVRYFRVMAAPILNAVASPVYSGTPNVTWNALPGASRYELKINNLTTGVANVFVQNSISTTSFQVPENLGLGRYAVQVRGMDAAGLPGQWAVPQRFTSASAVTLISPGLSTFNPQPTLTWEAVTGASRYEVTLKDQAIDSTIASNASIFTTSWTPVSQLPHGTYRWWVRAYSAAGIVGGWSLYKDFSVGGKPTLLNIPATTFDRTPTFSWTAVDGAASYEIWIALGNANVVVLNVRNLPTNSYTPLNDLAPQSYRVWIRAVSTTGVVSAWSSPVTFTVTETSPARGLPAESFDDMREILTVAFHENPTTCSPPAKATASGSPDAIDQPEIVAEPPLQAISQMSDLDRLMMEWAITG